MTQPRRWAMLVVSMIAQATGAWLINGAAFLIPSLQDEFGLTLVRAGTLAALPTVGVMLTLILWGAAVDRFGERRILVLGAFLLAAVTGAAAVAAGAGSLVLLSLFLLLGGMAGASASSASGRVVVGWFPPQGRGFAMGIRQMAQPLGVGLGALTVPAVADAYGVTWALVLPAVGALLAGAGCAIIVRNPPRPNRQEAASSGQLTNPYRRDRFLVRIHAVSALLVCPQAAVWTYGLVWLISERGWTPAAAGGLIAATQVLGAGGRIGAGVLSDRVGSRMRPLRWIAVAAALTMLVLALADQLDWAAAVALLVVATVVTVADNGLAFTSIAEVSGPFWSGRALGAQNTGQFLTAALIAPGLGGVITVLGFPAAFALVAVCPMIAVPLVPVRGEPALPR